MVCFGKKLFGCFGGLTRSLGSGTHCLFWPWASWRCESAAPGSEEEQVFKIDKVGAESRRFRAFVVSQMARFLFGVDDAS